MQFPFLFSSWKKSVLFFRTTTTTPITKHLSIISSLTDIITVKKESLSISTNSKYLQSCLFSSQPVILNLFTTNHIFMELRVYIRFCLNLLNSYAPFLFRPDPVSQRSTESAGSAALILKLGSDCSVRCSVINA